MGVKHYITCMAKLIVFLSSIEIYAYSQTDEKRAKNAVMNQNASETNNEIYNKNDELTVELRDEFINNPRKMNAEIISPLNFGFVKQTLNGKYDFIGNSGIGKNISCFLIEAQKEKILANFKYSNNGSQNLPKNLPELQKTLYQTARVDLIIVEKNTPDSKSYEFLIMGIEAPVFLYTEPGASPTSALRTFCNKLGYDGIVIGVKDGKAYIVSGNTVVDENTKAYSYILDSEIFFNSEKTSEKSASLEYRSTNSAGINIFKIEDGTPMVWQKVIFQMPKVEPIIYEEKATEEKEGTEAEKGDEEKEGTEAEQSDGEKEGAEAEQVDEEKEGTEAEQSDEEKEGTEAEQGDEEKDGTEAEQVDEEKEDTEAEQVDEGKEGTEAEQGDEEKESTEAEKNTGDSSTDEDPTATPDTDLNSENDSSN